MSVIEMTDAVAKVAQEEYERGFVDGMQEQTKTSVDRAVNAMCKREWVGLPDMQVFDLADKHLYGGQNYGVLSFYQAIEKALKEKNA